MTSKRELQAILKDQYGINKNISQPLATEDCEQLLATLQSQPSTVKLINSFSSKYSKLGRINQQFGLLRNNAEKKLKILEEKISNEDSIVRSIEFPPEYREAGTSILMYFNHILKLKYPDLKVKVSIEQDGLILRMLIHTPTGHKESIERTLEEYGRVVVGQLMPEDFLHDPFEVIALKNKLEIAHLELRQTRELLSLTQKNSQQRIESLEEEVDRLHRLIEISLKSKDKILERIGEVSRQDVKNYDFRGAKFGGGFAVKGGIQTSGALIDVSSTNNLSEAASQIRELLQQLQTQGSTSEEAKHKVASDLAKQAEHDSSAMGKLVYWGKSLVDTAGKTTVSEATKGVVKLAFQIAGIPMP